MLSRSVLRARQTPRFATCVAVSPTARLVPNGMGHAQPALAPLGSRGFKKIQVSNPLGIKLLRASRSVGKGLLAFYVVASATVLFFYFKETQKSDGVQKIPSDWPFKVKTLVREGVNHELDDHFDQALKSYQFAVAALVKDDKGQPVDLARKSPEWLTGYADVLARTGRILELFEQSEEAQAALEASFSSPWGSPELKSVAAVQLAKYAAAAGEAGAAEAYYVDAVRVVGDAAQAELFKAGDVRRAVLIPDGGAVSVQLYNATIELGKFYAASGRLTEAMEVLLATLRSVKQKREPEEGARDAGRRIPDANCFEARVMAYMAEILWASGKREEAVTWVESSYHESYPLSSTTVECGLCAQMAMDNAAKMYKHLGMPIEEEKSRLRGSSLNVPLTNVKPAWSILDLFSTTVSR